MSLWNVLVLPFGYIMRFCYNLFESYGIALILYAFITKVILLPLSMKQQKTQLNMVRLKPYQDELVKKYGHNKQKYQEELMKLYEREGYSPMSSCLPTFIQLPVIMLIYTIVRRPLTYLTGMSLKEMGPKMLELLEKFPDVFKGLTLENFHRYELQAFPYLAEGFNTKFLGIFDLTVKPAEFLKDGWFGESFWLILIPVLAGVTSYLVSFVSQKFGTSAATADAQAASSMKMMNIMMPLLSVWMSFTFTSALGFYWIASNIVAIAQVFLLNKIYDPKVVLKEVEDKMKREKEAEKEKRRLAAERRAMSNNKNSKKKRAMNAQSSAPKDDGDIDTEKGE